MRNRFYIFSIILFLIFSIVINYFVFKSMVAQFTIAKDSAQLISFEDVNKMFPIIPNVGVTTIPIDVTKAIYAIKDKKVDSIEIFIGNAIKANPYTSVGEYVKAKLFLSINQIDSARYYSNIAFYNWPKSSDYFNTYMETLVKQKDTLEILNAFNTLDSVLKIKSGYFKTFYDSYNKAKLAHLIEEFPDKRNLREVELAGEWIRSYIFPNNQIIKDTTLTYSFKPNNIALNKSGGEYVFKLKEDSIYYYFKSNLKKPIMVLGAKYSDEYKTLILDGVPKDKQTLQTQFFTKKE